MKLPRGVKLRRVSGKVNLNEWTLDAFDRLATVLGPIVEEATAEAIELALKSEDSYVSWPAESMYRGQNIADPLTIHVSIALSSNPVEDDPVGSFSLRDALSDAMEECREHGENLAGLKRIRDALRDFADEIDSAVAAAPAEEP